MADKGWKREFEDPIPLPDRRMLVTLLDAADILLDWRTKNARGRGKNPECDQP